MRNVPKLQKAYLFTGSFPKDNIFRPTNAHKIVSCLYYKENYWSTVKSIPAPHYVKDNLFSSPSAPNLELLALTDVNYVVYWFNEPPLICEQRYHEILQQSEAPLTYTPLVMTQRITNFMKDICDYLDEQMPCGAFIDLKCQELMYLIICYYPIPQLSKFFYPISSYTESFQYFVMQNYEKVKNVEEFAHLGGYTTTTFRRLFKNMYGVPVYEWILSKKREGILEDLQHTKQRITEISNRYGFDSLSHFAHFCKASFGDSPRALRTRAARGEKITALKTE